MAFNSLAEFWQMHGQVMLRPLMATLSGMYLFFGWLVLLYTRAEILERERNTRWVQTLVEVTTGGRHGV